MSKEEHSEEQSRDNPRSDFDFLDFSGKHFYYDVGYKTERYSVGNVVSERHHNHRHKRGNGHRNVRPVDIFHAAYHKHADVNESRAVSVGGNEFCERSEEEGD